MNANTTEIIASHKQWLEGTGGQRADLSGADLSGAYLRGADLRGAYLRDANLRGADLSGAYLRDADLRGADLRGADLRGADLRDADLRDADLSGAYLRDANLRGADLRDADLSGAVGLVAAWQGGAYGPRRRQITVLHHDGAIVVHAGCIIGTPAEVGRRLAVERLPDWRAEIADADAELVDALHLIDLGVAHCERRAAQAAAR